MTLHPQQRLRALVALALVASLVCYPAGQPASAAPGDLDPSFGTTGQVVTDVTGHFAEARGVAVQPDGMLVAAGTVAPNALGEASDFAVARYRTGGELDATFGAGGVATTDLNGDFDDARAVAIQPDGKIVVVGTTAGRGPSLDFAVVRYQADGKLDPTFGGLGTGMVSTDIGLDDGAFAVALQPDGKILVGGHSGGAFVVARYHGNGDLDFSFGPGGFAFPGVSSDSARVAGLVVQPAGEIVGFGPAGGNFVGFRMRSDGQLDVSFDLDGIVETNLEGDDEPRAVALAADQRIVVAGGSNGGIAVASYLENGELDSSFGLVGYVVSDLTEGFDEARSVLTLPSGGVLVGGVAGDDFALVRYRFDAGLDPAFGGDGVVTTDFAGGADDGAGLGSLPDGRIVLAGAAQTGPDEDDRDFAMARYQADGAPDGSFGDAGAVTTDVASTSDKVAAVGTDAAGRIVAAGYAATGHGWDFALARYQADGSLDGSFGLDGRVTTDLGGGDDQAYGLAFSAANRSIVVAGRSTGIEGDDLFTIARYRAFGAGIDGTLDPTFGDGGRVMTNLVEGAEEARAVAVQSDGKIVVAGFAGSDIVVVRYLGNGDLDPAFGVDGVVRTTLIGNAPVAHGIAIQPDGKIVVGSDVEQVSPAVLNIGAASTQFGGNRDIAVVRYLPNGELDPDFDADGVVYADIAFGHDEARAVGLQPNGAIVVAGRTVSGAPGEFDTMSDVVVLRLTPVGERDGSFGGGAGYVVTDVAGGRDGASALAIRPNGTIVVAGMASVPAGGPSDFGVVRYTADGSRDLSFDTDGIATTDVGGGNDEARGLAVRPDGTIVAAGSAGTGSRTSFAVVRFGSGGALDGLFGAGGRVVTIVAGDLDEARAVAVQPDGAVVAVGVARSGPTGDIAVLRYLPDGRLDSSFGTGGIVTTDLSGGADGGHAVALQADGKIIVAGLANGGPVGTFALVRYNANGSIDESFGTAGVVRTGISEGRAEATGVLVQPDGKIVAAGFGIRLAAEETPPLHHFVLARYLPDGTPDDSFAGDGLVITDVTGGDDEAAAVALQPDGRIVVAGRGLTAGGSQVALARYLPDGALDASFAGDGTVATELAAGPAQANALTLQPDGRIVAAGMVLRAATNRDVAVLRYNVDGSVDGSFGGGTGAVFGDAGPSDQAWAVSTLSDGGLLVAGHSIRESTSDVGLFRYRADGKPDVRFGVGSIVFSGVSGFGDEAAGMVVQPNGRVVVAGRAGQGLDGDFTVLRFVGGPSGPPADLALELKASADPASLAVPFSYVLTVRNFGPNTATDVTGTGELPATLRVLGAIPSQGAPCVLSPVRLLCSLGAIPPGGTAGITLIVQATKVGTLTTTAHVIGTEPDLNPVNDSVTTTITVQPPSVRVNPGVAPPGRVVAVLGSGFSPNVTVGIGFSGFGLQRTAVPDSAGSFAVQLVIFPNTTPGARSLEIRTIPAPAEVIATTKLLIVPDTLAPPNFVARS